MSKPNEEVALGALLKQIQDVVASHMKMGKGMSDQAKSHLMAAELQATATIALAKRVEDFCIEVRKLREYFTEEKNPSHEKGCKCVSCLHDKENQYARHHWNAPTSQGL